MTGGVLIHVQHLMGVGHQRRMAAIARALQKVGLAVCYVSGGFPVPELDVGDASFVQLPPARSLDASYQTLIGEEGCAVDEAWKNRRRQTLIQTYEQVRPQALLVETFPFGRRLLAFELVALMNQVRATIPSPVTICSIRDILEPKRKVQRNQEIVDSIRRWFDVIVVHSDPNFIALEETFPLVEQISDRLCYSGFVVDIHGIQRPRWRNDEILVSAGGGVGGAELLRAALAAAAMPRGRVWRWRCRVGPNFRGPAGTGENSSAPDNVTIEPNSDDFQHRLGECRLSVSQAGYNTVVETMALHTPCVLVPFAEAEETEQTRRAQIFAAKGLAKVLPAAELSGQTLIAAVEEVLARPRPGPAEFNVDVDGANRTASLIAQAIERASLAPS